MDTKTKTDTPPAIKTQLTGIDHLFQAAVQAIDSKFGPEYARKNPALVAKYIDLIIAERSTADKS
jgi:hypothetical protein